MIEANSSAEVPRAEAHLVLRVERGLDVPPFIGKLKLQLGARIEWRRVGDAVIQGFAHRCEERIGARFPVVAAVMPSDVRTKIAFAVSAILIDDDRGGQIIGAQNETGIAHASGETQK